MHKRILAFFFAAVISVAIPLSYGIRAHADTPPDWSKNDGSGWMSKLFDWHDPVADFAGYFSNLFEERQDNVENNSLQRDQLLIDRQTMAPFNTASTSPSYEDSSFAATSSDSLLPADQFEAKKTFIISQLMTAVNNLSNMRDELGDLVGHSNLDTEDQQTAENLLAETDIDIQSARSAITVLIDYQPDPSATSTDMIDVSRAESDLSVAISAISAARTSLGSVIDILDNS